MKRIVLHSTASHGAFYLFKLIDTSIWLLSNNRKQQKSLPDNKDEIVLELILHPIMDRISFLVFLSRIKRRLLSGIVKFKITKTALNTGSRTEELSLYDTVYRTKKEVSINTELGLIRIKLADKPLGSDILTWIKCYLKTIDFWLTIHRKGELVPARLLNLNYMGIIFGDLIASNALRINSKKSGGSISSCPGLFIVIFKALLIIEYIINEVKNIDSNSYVIIPEPTYLHGIYRRLLHSRGVNSIEPRYYSSEFKIIEPFLPLENPLIVENPIKTVLNDARRQRAISYLQERLQVPGKLWYMSQGNNSNDDKLVDLNDDIVITHKDKLYAGIFLHSFDDAQYLFGIDGFNDIFHWTKFTIEKLLSNKNIDTIFIKQHPNIDYARYPGDKVAVEKLKNSYRNNPRVIWLKSNCSLNAFPGIDFFVGITHHGSIAEELTSINIPVIASTFAPWGKAFRFLQTWSDRNEYSDMLKNLNIGNIKKPSDNEMDELYRFVTEYRIEVPSINNRSTWLKYLEFVNKDTPKVSADIFYDTEKKLSALRVDDLEFTGFVSELICQRVSSNC
jgi:hypothetical protein